MRRVVSALVLLPLVMLVSCAGGFKMVKQESRVEPTADPEKATLVIMRTTMYGFAVVMNSYVDGKYIGQTKGKCYFTTKVDPGEHWLIGACENRAVAKVTFEAGKMYYFEQLVIIGVMKARTGWEPRDQAYFSQQLPELTYITPEPGFVGEDMEADDLQEDMDNFEKEVVKDPERHRNTLEYKGF